MVSFQVLFSSIIAPQHHVMERMGGGLFRLICNPYGLQNTKMPTQMCWQKF